LIGAERLPQRRYPAGQVPHKDGGPHPLRRGEFQLVAMLRLAFAMELPEQHRNLGHSRALLGGGVLALLPAHRLAVRLDLVQLITNRPMTAASLPLPFGGDFHSLPSARNDAAG
jgi:hypothetical protein